MPGGRALHARLQSLEPLNKILTIGVDGFVFAAPAQVCSYHTFTVLPGCSRDVSNRSAIAQLVPLVQRTRNPPLIRGRTRSQSDPKERLKPLTLCVAGKNSNIVPTTAPSCGSVPVCQADQPQLA